MKSFPSERTNGHARVPNRGPFVARTPEDAEYLYDVRLDIATREAAEGGEARPSFATWTSEQLAGGRFTLRRAAVYDPDGVLPERTRQTPLLVALGPLLGPLLVIGLIGALGALAALTWLCFFLLVVLANGAARVLPPGGVWL